MPGNFFIKVSVITLYYVHYIRVTTEPGNQGFQGKVREFYGSGKISEKSGEFRKITKNQGKLPLR